MRRPRQQSKIDTACNEQARKLCFGWSCATIRPVSASWYSHNLWLWGLEVRYLGLVRLTLGTKPRSHAAVHHTSYWQGTTGPQPFLRKAHKISSSLPNKHSKKMKSCGGCPTYLDRFGEEEISDFSLIINALSSQISPQQGMYYEYVDPREEYTCKLLLKQFTDKQLDIVANTSYVYWYVSSVLKLSLDVSTRDKFAMKEVQRHVRIHNGSFHKSFVSLKTSINLRQTYEIEVLRTLFTTTDRRVAVLEQRNKNENDNTTKTSSWSKLEDIVSEYIQKQPQYVLHEHCRTKSCAILHLLKQSDVSSKSAIPKSTAEDALLVTQLYLIERGLAVTELELSSSSSKTSKLVGEDAIRNNGMNSITLDMSRLDKPSQTIWNTKHQQLLEQMYPGRFTITTTTKTEVPSTDAAALWKKRIILSQFRKPNKSRTKNCTKVRPTTTTAATTTSNKGGDGNKNINNVTKTSPNKMDLYRFLYNVPFHHKYDDGCLAKSLI